MLIRQLAVTLIGLLTMIPLAFADSKITLEHLDTATLSGDKIELRLHFDTDAPEPQPYQISKPTLLIFDIPHTRSTLSGKMQYIGNGNVRNLTVVEMQNSTRLILNLHEPTDYHTRIEGKQLYITIGKNAKPENTAISEKPRPAIPNSVAASSYPNAIENIDFHRGNHGDGQVLIDLRSGPIPVDIQQQDNKIIARFTGVSLPENLHRRLDVVDFVTPVKTIDTYTDGNNSMMVIQPQGDYDYLSSQSGNRLTISIKPVNKNEDHKKTDSTYAGEKLSLNFQDIEVRSVLQLIADFTSLNLVASDSVKGKITLRLQNIPWDQALDLILKTKGLDKRTIGNVMLIAPADEIAQHERLEMENDTQSEKLLALHSELIQINYAKAVDLLKLITGPGKLLSERGMANVDLRTNTLIVVDTAKRIEAIHDMVIKLDIPVKQVLIEARIILTTAGYDKELGVR